MHSLLEYLLSILRRLRTSISPVTGAFRRWLVLWSFIRRHASHRTSSTSTHHDFSLPPSLKLSTEDSGEATIFGSSVPSSTQINAGSQTFQRPENSSRPPNLRSTRSQVGHDMGASSSRGPHSRFGSSQELPTRQRRARSCSPASVHSVSFRPSSPMRLNEATARPGSPHFVSSSRGDFDVSSVGINLVSPSQESIPRSNEIEHSVFIAEPLSANASPSSSQESIQTTSTFYAYLDYPNNRELRQSMPEKIPRYEKRATVPRIVETTEISPITTNFPYSEKSHSGSWTPATHPDGALYFYDREQKIYTDDNMYDKKLRQEVQCLVDYLGRCLANLPHHELPKDHELVEQVDEIRVDWHYYYVDHTSQTLFWLHHMDMSYVTAGVSGVTSPAHMKHRLEAQYWYHWYLYPSGHRARLAEKDYDQLLGILLHGCIDLVTSPTSTTPYNLEETQLMYGLIKDAKKTGPQADYLACCVGRLLSHYAEWSFVHFHGQPAASLDSGRSVHGAVARPRSALITVLSPLLFFSPELHLKEIENLCTDEIVMQLSWQKFFSRLQTEWQDFILLATVLLTVNVGFLAIPGVIPVNDDNSVASASSTQIASYISVLASAGSIILGLLLLRLNRNRANVAPEEAATYMRRNKHPFVGLEPMAILFSVPYALLLWAMLTFLLALLLSCFVSTRLPTRIPVGICSFILACLVVWCIRHSWEACDESGQVWAEGIVPSLGKALQHQRTKIRGYWSHILSPRSRKEENEREAISDV